MQRIGLVGVVFAVVALLFPAWGCGGSSGGGGGGGGTGGFTTFQPAALVIGQADFASILPNRGGGPGADTLHYPLGRCTGDLFVPDQNNHRVLGFAGFPPTNGAPAAFALGQPDLVTAASGTGASNFENPTDLSVDGTKLAVADWSNNRVLLWNTLPSANGAAADLVVGQPGFGVPVTGFGPDGCDHPAGVCLAGGRLFVADQLNNRVMIWNTVPTVNGASADVAVGQANLMSNTAGTSSTQLRGPMALWSDGVRLVVADSANNRVLIWNTIPTTHGVAADIVVCQPDFVTGTPAVGPQGCYGTAGLTADADRLIVSDRLNNRVLIFQPFPTASNPAASVVLGQSNFTNNAPNDDDQDGTTDTASARTLNQPAGLSLRGNDLLVTDQLNSRVLVFSP